MKLVKAIKKTKKKTDSTIAVAENRAVMAPPSPPRAEPARSAPQPKLSLPEARSIAPAPCAPPATTIEALIDVGFGNQLFLRGQGAGLSWERGTPLECVDGQTWRWSAPTADKLTFKLLLNDKVWAQGEDIVATPGKCIGVVPRF